MHPGTLYKTDKKCETCGRLLWVVPLWINGWALQCEQGHDGNHPEIGEWVAIKPQPLRR